jgi:hypothetical protein
VQTERVGRHGDYAAGAAQQSSPASPQHQGSTTGNPGSRWP